MKESYKLADGSLSSDYEVGDTFVVYRSGQSRYFSEGDVIIFYQDDGSYCPWFFRRDNGDTYSIAWEKLTPTEQTKRKYQKNSTSTFTKSDLQDGMRVTYREGDVRIVLEGNLVYLDGKDDNDYGGYRVGAELVDFNEDLTHEYVTKLDIMCVEDRDGTLLFERQEAPVKKAVTLELTDEQIQSLEEQGIL